MTQTVMNSMPLSGVGHCVKRTCQHLAGKHRLVRHHGGLTPGRGLNAKYEPCMKQWCTSPLLMQEIRKFKIMFNLAKMLQNRVLAPFTWSKWHKPGILGILFPTNWYNTILKSMSNLADFTLSNLIRQQNQMPLDCIPMCIAHHT